MDNSRANINDIIKLFKQLDRVVLKISKKFLSLIILINDFKTVKGYGIKYSLFIEKANKYHTSITNNIDDKVNRNFLILICLIIEVIIR